MTTRMRARRAWMGCWAVAAALSAGGMAGCAVNPVTGQRQLSLVSEQQEIQIGQQSAQQAAQEIGLVPDSALQQYVQRVGAGLAATSERPNLPWTFRVVDDPTPNAFALPGGYIFVTRGLMDLMTSEAELGTVLGHEIGHVTARHQVTMMSRAQLAQIGLGLGSILFPQAGQSLGGLASSGLQLLFLRYSRDAERQADDLGFRYALNQHYDVREMAAVFRSLERVTAAQSNGRSPLPSWLATHPGEEERIAAVQRRLATTSTAGATRVESAAYLQRVDGLIYGENPRQGYFQGGLFLHPDLRFSIQFPNGWQTQNLPQSVSAGSPRQDAIIQLTLAERARTADEAARGFFSSQSVRAGQSSRENVHGSPAILAYFQAQTQQGIVSGLAGWIEYGGNVYQVLAFAPSTVFPQYDRLFQQVIGSFGPVSDPRVLNVRPNRVDVVRLPQAMTLAAFNQRYPSVVPLSEIAILNQVESETASFPAGALVKRVVRE